MTANSKPTAATPNSASHAPIDKQTFHIWFVPLEYGEDEVRFVADENFTGRRDLLNISSWMIGDVSSTVDREYVAAFDRFHSVYIFRMPATRVRAYYTWKVFLPICLIVAMSWCVFWMNPADAGAQIGVSATSMLTLIAFIFATTNMLPALGYLTVLDQFIGISTILVFLALLQSVTTSYLVYRESAELARRIDIVCRLAFPAVFVAISVLILFR